MMSFKKTVCIITAVISVLSFAGCSVGSSTDTTSSAIATDAAAYDENTGISDMFTSFDVNVGYDENNDTVITLADNGTKCKNGPVTIDDNTVTISDEGTYIFKGTLSDGSIVVDADDSDKVHIIFAGVNISKSTTAAVYVKSADKVVITLAPNTENTLTNTGDFVAIDDNNIDACVFSKDDLTFNGSGSITISSETGHGIVSKDTLCVTGGTYTVDAEKHCLAGKDDVRIMNGTFNLTSGKDGIHGDNDEDDELGFVYIEDGTYTINAGDDGIHSSASLKILGGTINIEQSYEGLEGHTVDISGGTIDIISSDDGINAAGGDTGSDPGQGDSEAYINISGGEITIDASGDGVDSNGDLYVSGGTLTVYGPVSGGDGAIDYGDGNTTAKITGGTVFAFGTVGMAENFNAAENQGVALVNISGNAGDTVEIKNDAGETLGSATSKKNFDCVVISCAGMTENGTFTVSNGTNSTEITLSGFIYGESGMGGNMGGDPGQGGGQGGNKPDGNFEPETNENGQPEIPSGGQGGNPGGQNGQEPETDESGRPQKPDDNGNSSGQNTSNT
jgi:hypothetical protein